MAAATLLNPTVIAILISVAAAATSSYTNHTVGGDAGWFFDAKTNKSVIDYASWAKNQTFKLGDYLIFNTNTNQSVVQTFNKTTYQTCDVNDDGDTLHFNSGETDFGKPVTIPVALIKIDTNYFFSDSDDGIQCQTGMAFEISVERGIGLPPSLNQPPPPPYREPPGADDSPSPPINIAGGSPAVDNTSSASSYSLSSYVVLFMLPLLLLCV